MRMQHSITEDEAVWLRLLESREYDTSAEPITIPEDVVDALVQKGFVRRWRDGNVTITLGGMREVAREVAQH